MSTKVQNERKPLLSNYDLRGEPSPYTKGWYPNAMHPKAVRDFYEGLIDIGRLRVVEEVEWSKYCSVCDWKLEMDNAYSFCPGCGNKLKR